MRDHGLVVAERRVPPRGAQETCLPRHPTAWRPIKHRQEVESAHGLAMQVLEIADAAGPHDNPQLVKKPLRSAALACGQIQRALLGPGGNHRQRRRLDRWAVSEDVGRGESGMGSSYSSPERAVLEVPTIDREDR